MWRFHDRYHDVHGVAPQLGELRFDVDPTVEREIVDAPLARLHILTVVQLAVAKRELPPDQVLVRPERRQHAAHRLRPNEGDVARKDENIAFETGKRAFRLLHDFCAVQVSAVYGNAMKDRLYCDPASSKARHAGQASQHAFVSGPPSVAAA